MCTDLVLASSAISRGQQEVRLRQLRDLIYPQVTMTVLLRRYLEEAHWDGECTPAPGYRACRQVADECLCGSTVARAYARYTRDRERILAGEDDTSSFSSLSSLSSSSDTGESKGVAVANTPLRQQMEDLDLPFDNNIEQERRDTALAFRLRIEDIHNYPLSISEAVLLLHLADWDIGVALASFEGYDEARNRLRIAFDGMRDYTDDANERSARIAALVEITERADWLSMKLFLEKKNWNFVSAIVSWYRRGIRPFTNDEVRGLLRDRPHWALRVDHNGRVREKPTNEECRVAPEAEAGGWNEETPDFTNPLDPHPPPPTTHSQRTGRNYNSTNPRAAGFIIHPGANTTVKAGPPDISKFLLEYISKGQYRFNMFEHPKYFFPDRIEDLQGDTFLESDEDEPLLPSDDASSAIKFAYSSSSYNSPQKGRLGKRTKKEKTPRKPRKRSKAYTKPVVDFNFETPSHLADLNACRRQNRSLIEGSTLRAPAQPWTQEELDFLYQLTLEWLDDLKAKHPHKTRKELLETSDVLATTKSDWEKRMNVRFTGTVANGSTEPRRDRKAAAIMTMRGRYARLFVHFRANADKKWRARVDPAEIARLERERDAMEAIDLLLTAGEVLHDEPQGQQVSGEGEEEEKSEVSDVPSDVAEASDQGSE